MGHENELRSEEHNRKERGGDDEGDEEPSWRAPRETSAPAG